MTTGPHRGDAENTSFPRSNQTSEWTLEKEERWRKNHAREAALADELVDQLDAPGSIAFFRKCALRYNESYLRRIAAYVSQIPENEVQTARGAIFNSILKKRYG